MNLDDIIYLSLLAFSMGFGLYYRTMSDVGNKRKLGAALGLAIVVIVSGIHTLHILISTFVNTCIILYGDKGKCHVFSFFFSFLYLLFFRSTTYFGIPYPPSHTNLVQMMATLKIIGLAFEINSCYVARKKEELTKTDEERIEEETICFDLEFMDIFYYIFNYCGVLTGPYFRYRTYLDHLKKPYHKYDNFKPILMKRFHWVPILAAVHLFTNYYWPISYVSTSEFMNRSFFYRYWYIWPSFLIFRSRIYLGLILTEIVCIIGGMGVYPALSVPKAGHGPTQNFRQLKEITNSEEKLEGQEYNYDTIHCINPYEADCLPTMREAMKHWNITIQYWLATYIYKRYPYKKYRTLVTMFMSAVWHGVYAGYYFCIATVPFSLMCEDVWVKLLLENKKGTALKISRLVMLFLKMQMFSYQATAFVLLEVGKIISFYNSIYHCVPIFYVGLYLLGKYLLKQREIKER